MKVKLILGCFLLASVTLQAQVNKIKYQPAITVGLAAGQGNPAFQVQAINAVNYKTWSAGIGVGLDYYHTRSVPVFLDLRKTLSSGLQPAFLYVNGGYNIPWLNDDYEFSVLDSKGGLYFDGGIGVLLPVLKKRHLFFSAGWSAKQFSKTVNTMPFLSIWPPPKDAWREYEYTVTTISLKAGFRF